MIFFKKIHKCWTTTGLAVYLSDVKSLLYDVKKLCFKSCQNLFPLKLFGLYPRPSHGRETGQVRIISLPHQARGHEMGNVLKDTPLTGNTNVLTELL